MFSGLPGFPIWIFDNGGAGFPSIIPPAVVEPMLSIAEKFLFVAGLR